MPEVTSAVGKALRVERLDGRRLARVIGAHVGVGDVLAGDEGFTRVVGLSAAIDGALARFLHGRDGMRHFAALRQLSPRLWAHDAGGAGIAEATRRTAELAVHRYADWSGPVELPYEELVWTDRSIAQLGVVVAHGEAVANLMSARRRIAKGQVVRITSVAPLGFDVEDPPGSDLDELIRVRDLRVDAHEDPLGSVGATAPRPVGENIVGVVSARWVDPREVATARSSGTMPVERLTDGSFVLLEERIARWGVIGDIHRRREVLLPYDAALREAHGCGVTDLDAVLHVLTMHMFTSWSAPVVPRTLDLYGFVLLEPPPRHVIDEAMHVEPYRAYAMGLRPTPASLSAALALLDAGLHPVPLEHPLGQRPLRQLPGALLYDAVNVAPGGPVLWDATLPESVRDEFAHRFEQGIHDRLAAIGPQPWGAGKRLRVAGRDVTDVDASVVVGTLLVVVDCYGAPWSSDLDQGSHKVTRNRAQHLVRKLRKWDEQWSNVVRQHPHLLPAGIDAVLPVVVTASPEWVHSRDEDLWFSHTVPRICTPAELEHLLRRPRVARRRGVIPCTRST